MYCFSVGEAGATRRAPHLACDSLALVYHRERMPPICPLRLGDCLRVSSHSAAVFPPSLQLAHFRDLSKMASAGAAGAAAVGGAGAAAAPAAVGGAAARPVVEYIDGADGLSAATIFDPKNGHIAYTYDDLISECAADCCRGCIACTGDVQTGGRPLQRTPPGVHRYEWRFHLADFAAPLHRRPAAARTILSVCPPLLLFHLLPPLPSRRLLALLHLPLQCCPASSTLAWTRCPCSRA